MSRLVIASVVLALGVVHADAQGYRIPAVKLNGTQFYHRCTNPPSGKEIEVLVGCEMYVAGIADGLEDGGKICFGPRVNRDTLFGVSLHWLRANAAYGIRPANFMISRGLEHGFPCRAANNRMPSQANTDNALNTFANIAKFMKTVSAIVSLL